MKLPKEFRPLAKLARAQEWTIERTHGGHLRWTSPTGEKVFTSSTPSEWRSLDNTKRELARKGLQLS